MLKDIHFRFVGFHRSEGHCHIRLAKHDKSKPMVIVCSQYKNYSGTSVTNALEIIAETLFNKIAQDEITGVHLDGPLPVFREWHDDANALDKFLAKFFPEKYGERFSDWKVNWVQLFKKVTWIEHYPVDETYSDPSRTTLVTLDSEGHANWHALPSEAEMIDTTGFMLGELLPQETALNLAVSEVVTDTSLMQDRLLASHPGSHHVRWTKEIVDVLPSLMSSERMRRGVEDRADLEEAFVQAELEKFFAVRLPARELFVREYPFSKRLGIQTTGAEKSVDFAIFTPEGNGSVDSILEVKRTSSRSSKLLPEVMKDIARLLLLSKLMGCSCYLLICGDAIAVESLVEKMQDLLSWDDSDLNRDRHYRFAEGMFSDEYRDLLSRFSISYGASRFQSRNQSGLNVVAMWQIAIVDTDLATHRAYRFNLSTVERF